MTWTEIGPNDWELDIAPYRARAYHANGTWRWLAKGPGRPNAGKSSSLETAHLEASLALLEMHQELGRPLVAAVRECTEAVASAERKKEPSHE